MTEIHPLQPFRVSIQSDLTYLQRRSLVQLYQPLVGVRAVGFYFTLLYQPLESRTVSQRRLHSYLFNQMNIGRQEIVQSRLALEAVGLLRTYRQESPDLSEDKCEIIYDLQLPLEIQAFFEHPLYSTALFSVIGDEAYEQLLHSYETETLPLANYQELTHSFEEVFTVRSQSAIIETQEAIEGRQLQKQYSHTETTTEVDVEDFDYSRFLRYLMAESINHQELTQAFKEQIISLHQMYELDEATLVEVTRLAYNPLSKQIETKQLKRIAAKRYQDQKAEQETMAELDQPTFPRDYSPQELAKRKEELSAYDTNFSTSDIEVIVTTEQIPVELFLEMTKKSKDGFATSSEKYFVRELQKVSQLPPAVINLLIYYLLVIQENENIYRQVLDRIANQWQQQGIDSPEEALSHIQQQARIEHIRKQSENKRQSGRSYYQSPRREETIPSWMKESPVSTPDQETQSSPTEDTHLAQRVQDQLQQLYQQENQEEGETDERS